MGELHTAHVITVSDGVTTVTIEISVYTYLRFAVDANLTDEEKDIIKALYDFNEAVRID